jgi:hypothetical protein
MEARCLLAEDVPGRESDILDGRISIQCLRSNFAFVSVEDDSIVDDRHWWPSGPLIVVHFSSVSVFTVHAAAHNGKSMFASCSDPAVHQLVVPARSCKAAALAMLDAHVCGNICCEQLVICFRSLTCDRVFARSEHVYDVHRTGIVCGRGQGSVSCVNGTVVLVSFRGVTPSNLSVSHSHNSWVTLYLHSPPSNSVSFVRLCHESFVSRCLYFT